MATSPLEAFQQQCLGLIEASLRTVSGLTATVLHNDDSFRRLVIDPTWDLVPLPIKMLGRKRLCWDAIFFALRDETFQIDGDSISLRPNARQVVASVVLRVLGRQRQDEEPAEVPVPSPKVSQEKTAPCAVRQECSPAVGIDLGTTFSVIAHLDSTGRPWTIPNSEGDLITPSVVFFDGSSIVVGKEAVKAAAVSPEDVAQFVKLDMGGPVYEKPIHGEHLPPEVIQSFVLEKLRRDAALKLGNFRKVVISVPAFFNEPRRKATQDAGALAGLEVIDIINEPTAAAIAYGVQQGFLTTKGEAKDHERILVYDLGGGTFDVTLMEIDGKNYTAIATAGDVRLGGIDWDRRIADHIADAYAKKHRGIDPRTTLAGMQRLLREAEDAKRTLSIREQTTVTFEHAGEAIRVPITRQQLEQMTADLLDRTRFTTVSLLQDAGLRWSDITRLLVVGGSSRMPMVGRMLEEVSGKKVDRSLSADESVAHGAAIYASLILAAEGGTPPKVAVRNVNSHNLGVLGVEKATGRPRTHVMIPRNTAAARHQDGPLRDEP